MSEETYIGWSWYWIEEWSQFFDSCNWYTFHPILMEIEDEPDLGGIEATFIILGLGFRVRWNHSETELLQSIREQVAEISRGSPPPVQERNEQ